MHLCLLIVLSLQVAVLCYFTSPACVIRLGRSHTSLLAHHVNKKITKRMMDRRPKKSRPSDIFRNNVNFDKCITKLDNSPAEYTIISENDPHLVNPMDFWTNGDPEEEWLDITDEDRVLGLTSNIEPLSKEAIRKKPPLVRSGTW